MDISRGYQGIPKLIEIGKSNLYPLLWPSIKSAVRAGKAVKFGRIILRKEGLEISKKTITWESIARLHTAAGFLVVELHDKSSRKVPTINIPNLELLLEAVEWGHQ